MKNTLLAPLLLFSSLSQASLVGRLPATPGGSDYQAWYDTSTDLTWTMDGTIGVLDGWRLPTLDPNDTSNLSTNEMANLYYNTLGNTGDMWNFNPGPFTFPDRYNNCDPVTFGDYCLIERWYASDITVQYPECSDIWMFDFDTGRTLDICYGYVGINYMYVHDGDVSNTPILSSVYLFISGLIGILGISRRTV